MTVLVTKNTANNTMYSVQEPYTFLSSFNVIQFKVPYKSFNFYQYFYCILLLIHQLFFFYIFLHNFYNLGILLCHMIYPIHNYNY